MWETLKSLILRLFGVKLPQTDRQYEQQSKWASVYENVSEINLTAMISGKLATLTTTDAVIAVEGDNKRTEALQNILNENVLNRARKIVSAALGTGGVVLVPYSADGKQILVDMVPQNCFFITEKIGNTVTKACILADYIIRDNKKYMRWTDYALESGACVIRNRATVENSPCALGALTEWKNIPEEIRVPGSEHLLFGYMKCPTDNRRPDETQGVPITYGCDKLIALCLETLEEEANEYRIKRGFLGVDSTLFGKDDKLPKGGLFKIFESGTADEDLWKEYSPEIRHAAYSARVQELFGLLEKAIGVSKGILTTPDPVATATAVKHNQHDTWALVGEIRKNLAAALNDLSYALNVLCNYYGISPAGDYVVKYTWDLSLLEDTATTWQQMKDGYSMGLFGRAELRSWQTGETLEQAQKAVDEIAEKEPKLQDLIGNAE